MMPVPISYPSSRIRTSWANLSDTEPGRLGWIRA